MPRTTLPQRRIYFSNNITLTELIQRLLRIDASILYMYATKPTDTTINTDPISGKVMTMESTIIGRKTSQGNGFSVSFVSGSGNYGVVPDAANLTLSTFSIMVVAKITDTANARHLIGKWSNGSAGEYRLRITTADKLQLSIIDSVTGGQPELLSNAIITPGIFKLLTGTYSAVVGGANAAADMLLYDGKNILAAAGTEDALYVTMRDTTKQLAFGGTEDAAQLFDGSLAFGLLTPTVLSSYKIDQIRLLLNDYFGLVL